MDLVTSPATPEPTSYVFIDDITPSRATVEAVADTYEELAWWRHASKTGRSEMLPAGVEVGDRIWLAAIVSD